MNRPPSYIQRLLAAVILAAAFIIMASVFNPDPTGAGEAEPGTQPNDAFATTNPHEGLKLLGSLQNGRYTVRVYATAQGPRYSVYNAAGHLLMTLRTAGQVESQYPDLPLPVLDSDTPEDDGAPAQIMKAEPHDGGL